MIVQVQVSFLKDRPAWILGTGKIQQNDVASVLSVFFVSQTGSKMVHGVRSIGYDRIWFATCLPDFRTVFSIILLLDSVHM